MLKASSFFKEENDPFYRRGEARGVAIGEARGVAIGEARLKAEKAGIAKELKLEGMSTDQISRITGLPVSDIQKL